MIIFFLSFILFTGTIAPSITIPINAQNTFTCPNTFETFGVEYKLKLGNPTTTDPSHSAVTCLYESENAQFSGFSKNPYFTVSWSSIPNERNSNLFCHQFQKIYKKSGELQSIYSNEKIAKVSAAKTSDMPLEDVNSFATSLLRQAESLAEQCPYGQSKSSIESTMLINCPATFSTKGLIYSLDRAISTIDDPQLMRWGCDYRTHYNDAEEKGLPDNLLFTMRWVEELGQYKYDTGCKSGEEFTFNAVPQVWSKEFHVFAAGPAYAESIPTSDINSVLLTLVEQAESTAVHCDIEFVQIAKEFDEELILEKKECLSKDSDLANKPVGIAAGVDNAAFIKRHGEEKWEKIERDTIINFGDVVKTGDGVKDRLKIRFADEIAPPPAGPWILNLSSDTEICIADLLAEESGETKTILELIYGKIQGLFKGFDNHRSSMEVRTGTTVTGVRGTDFVLSYDPVLDKVSHYLNEGKLEITETTTGETQTLTAGQTLEISNGQMQPVSTLTSTFWDSLVEETGGVITVIPDWVKNNAGWWADDMIGDLDFAQGIAYLLSEGIMTIPETTQEETTGDTLGIPSWIKNNAGWWADGQITDDDFIKGIQFLVGQGIIRV